MLPPVVGMWASRRPLAHISTTGGSDVSQSEALAHFTTTSGRYVSQWSRLTHKPTTSGRIVSQSESLAHHPTTSGSFVSQWMTTGSLCYHRGRHVIQSAGHWLTTLPLVVTLWASGIDWLTTLPLFYPSGFCGKLVSQWFSLDHNITTRGRNVSQSI